MRQLEWTSSTYISPQHGMLWKLRPSLRSAWPASNGNLSCNLQSRSLPLCTIQGVFATATLQAQRLMTHLTAQSCGVTPRKKHCTTRLLAARECITPDLPSLWKSLICAWRHNRVFHGDLVAMVTTYLGLRIMPQHGSEFGPGIHGYNRAWLVRDASQPGSQQWYRVWHDTCVIWRGSWPVFAQARSLKLGTNNTL
jgi:hypothetical protein